MAQFGRLSRVSGLCRDARRASDSGALELRSGRRRHGQPALGLFPDFSTGIQGLKPWGADKYNSLLATLNRRFANGLTLQAAYTYSKDIGMTTSILIPQ
jgi:hypothetical protein